MARVKLENKHIWIIDDTNSYRAMNQNEIQYYNETLLGLIETFNNQDQDNVSKFLNRDNDYVQLEKCKVLPTIAETDKNTQLKRIVADCLDEYLVKHGTLPDKTKPIVEAVKNHPDVFFVGYTIYINTHIVKIELIQNCIKNLIKIYSK